jgi:hypothetical protein
MKNHRKSIGSLDLSKLNTSTGEIPSPNISPKFIQISPLKKSSDNVGNKSAENSVGVIPQITLRKSVDNIHQNKSPINQVENLIIQGENNVSSVVSPRGYKSTKNLILGSSIDSPRFWDNKFSNEFPTANFLKFWSSETNYIIQKKENFCVIVDLNPYQQGEFTEFVDALLSIPSNKISSRYIEDTVIPINMTKAKRYLVVRISSKFTNSWFDSFSEAETYVKNHRGNEVKNVYYTVIDISGLTPYIFSSGKTETSLSKPNKYFWVYK